MQAQTIVKSTIIHTKANKAAKMRLIFMPTNVLVALNCTEIYSRRALNGR